MIHNYTFISCLLKKSFNTRSLNQNQEKNYDLIFNANPMIFVLMSYTLKKIILTWITVETANWKFLIYY